MLDNADSPDGGLLKPHFNVSTFPTVKSMESLRSPAGPYAGGRIQIGFDAQTCWTQGKYKCTRKYVDQKRYARSITADSELLLL
jgi:hypothetical protein